MAYLPRYALFKERGNTDAMIVTRRSQQVFSESCEAHGGTIVPADDLPTGMFRNRVIAHLTRPTGYRHQWRGEVAICDGSGGEPLVGFVSLLMDNSEISRSGDIGSQVMGRLFGGLSNTTAIYLFHPDRLPTVADAAAVVDEEERRIAAVEERFEAASERIAEFQRNLAIGDESNCGTVIEVRGPMAEIAVPTNRRAPNGESTFWSRIERLAPPGYAICTFGL